jgi:hypothetical protein
MVSGNCHLSNMTTMVLDIEAAILKPDNMTVSKSAVILRLSDLDYSECLLSGQEAWASQVPNRRV